MPIRSGRFKSKNANTTPIKIIHAGAGRESAVYRFFNSGDVPFTIQYGGTDYPLAQDMSIDIGLRNAAVSIQGVNDTDTVEGIYDFLHLSLPIRSGRFKVAAASTSIEHLIIDTGNSAGGFYRIFNSGDKDIRVIERPSPSATATELLDKLKPDLSFDFKAAKNRLIYVHAFNVNEAIEGIYEFLGHQ